MKTLANNSIIEFYSHNSILNETFKLLSKQLHAIPANLAINASMINDRAFTLLSGLRISRIFTSITTSNTLFLRFTSPNNYEFKFEIFYDYDEEDKSDIQSTLHIYHNGQKEGAYFGSIEYLYNIANKFSNSYYACYEFSKNPLAQLDPTLYGRNPALSPAITTYNTKENYITYGTE